MTEPQKYIGKPTEVEAIQVSQYGDFVRARDWINSGQSDVVAHFLEKGKGAVADQLVLVYPLSTRHVFAGEFIVRGPNGVQALSAEEFAGSYARAFDDPPEDQEWEDTTGTYLPRGKEGKSLLGGAALQIPT